MLQFSLMFFALIVPTTDSPNAPALSKETSSRALTDEELNRLLPGSIIAKVVPVEREYLLRIEEFKNGGIYVQHDDNDEIRGRYAIEGNRICVTVPTKEKTCRFLLTDPYGRYWISHSLNPDFFQNVTVTK